MADIRVLVVDDHAILRDGIRSLLERQEDIHVVGEAANGREAIERVQALLPDLC
jgi:DNA-binding NarL/FixJ family response regulator